MTEQEAKQLEVNMEWNGRANVCVHCGRVPETFYIVTGHDHTDDEIRWCLCRKPLTPKKSEREALLEAEVMRLREIIEKLWVVIDDIDTYSDMAKADDKLYRSLVERRQKDRWGTGINCDGYKLEFPTPFTLTALNELIEKGKK